MTATFLDRVLTGGRSLLRSAAPVSVRTAIRPLIAGIVERRAFAGLAEPEPAPTHGPLLVSGLISEMKGISQAARLTVAGLEAAGYAPIAHDVRHTLDLGPGGGGRLPAGPGGVWIVHCNAPEAVSALACLDPASWRGRYRIGYWAYELPIAPPAWARAARLFHEIWTPSAFVAQAMTDAGVETPLRVMPHPATLACRHVVADRARFGFGDSEVCVLAMGDLLSSAARKNLLGAIDIYRRAFPEPDGRVRLVVKALSSGSHPAFTARAQEAAHGRSDISFLNENLFGDAVLRLIASADILLSPHRAEGYGLALAEAFALGTPALATGWSGNMDFMGETPELLIGHTLTPVRDQYGVYSARGLVWAEPDVEDAAVKLRRLAASPGDRLRLAAAGAAVVARQGDSWSRARLAETALGEFASPVAADA